MCCWTLASRCAKKVLAIFYTAVRNSLRWTLLNWLNRLNMKKNKQIFWGPIISININIWWKVKTFIHRFFKKLCTNVFRIDWMLILMEKMGPQNGVWWFDTNHTVHTTQHTHWSRNNTRDFQEYSWKHGKIM